MKLKEVTTALLLLFVGVSVAFLVVKETRSRPENGNAVEQTALAQEPLSTIPPGRDSAATKISQASSQTPRVVPTATAAPAKSQPSVSDRTVVAYYFHGNFRCPTCRKIEALSREAVESGFPEDLKAGRLEWRVINVEEPETSISSRTISFSPSHWCWWRRKVQSKPDGKTCKKFGPWWATRRHS